MSQMSFSDFEYAGKRKQTRRERFLAEMEQVDADLALFHRRKRHEVSSLLEFKMPTLRTEIATYTEHGAASPVLGT